MPFGPARQAASSRNRRSFRWSGRYRERSGGHGRGLGCRGRARPGRVPPCLRNCGDLRFGNGVAVVLGTAVRNSLLRSETARSDGRVPDFRRHSVTPGEKSEAVRCQRRRREGKPRRVSFRPRGDLLRDVVGPLRARGGRCPPSRRRGGPAGAGERAVRPPLARCGTSPQAEGHRLSREILISRPDRPPPDRPDRHRAPVSSLRSLSLHSSVPPHRANHSEPGGTRAEGTRSTRSASRSSSGFPMYSALPARKNGLARTERRPPGALGPAARLPGPACPSVADSAGQRSDSPARTGALGAPVRRAFRKPPEKARRPGANGTVGSWTPVDRGPTTTRPEGGQQGVSAWPAASTTSTIRTRRRPRASCRRSTSPYAMGRLLLIRRSDNGNRAPPGGAVDLGERLAEAGVRDTGGDRDPLRDHRARRRLHRPRPRHPLHRQRRGPPGVLHSAGRPASPR
ncbi:hypothetical protein ABH917_004012 [Thermobifida halotolerans]